MNATTKEKLTIMDRVVRRIRARGRGSVFSSKEFLDLGGRAAIDQVLSRLARAGTIRRLAPGLYDYPRTSPKLGMVLSPLYDKVAQAIAKKTGSKIQPSGALAANELGLSTQVPAKRVYLTDGPSRVYRIGKQIIVLKHAAPKEMVICGRISGRVFQALRHLGRRGVGDIVIRRLRRSLSSKDKAILSRDVRHASDWMRPIVEQVVEKG
jgi:hypothetical protein